MDPPSSPQAGPGPTPNQGSSVPVSPGASQGAANSSSSPAIPPLRGATPTEQERQMANPGRTSIVTPTSPAAPPQVPFGYGIAFGRLPNANFPMPSVPSRAETAPVAILTNAVEVSSPSQRSNQRYGSPGNSPLGMAPGQLRAAPPAGWTLPPIAPHHRRTPSGLSVLGPLEGSKRGSQASPTGFSTGIPDRAMDALSASSGDRSGGGSLVRKRMVPPTAASVVMADEQVNKLRRGDSLINGYKTGGGLAEVISTAHKIF